MQKSGTSPSLPVSWSSMRAYDISRKISNAHVGLLALSSTFSSSTPAALVPTFINEFGISQEVGTLTVSLFVCGYCVGPLLWGPLSEQYGRRPIFIISFFIYMVSRRLHSLPDFHSSAFIFKCFQIGCALSQNIASILIFRFLGGTFAAAPLANSG